MKKENTLTVSRISLYLLGFVLFWALLSDAWGYSARFLNFPYGSTLYALISRILWVLPVFYLIRKYNRFLYFPKRELLGKINWNQSLYCFMMLAVFIPLIQWVLSGKSSTSTPAGVWIAQLFKCLMVAAVEELVFRGWGYNSLLKIIPNWKAVCISTLFFILLHWPAYFIRLYLYGALDWSGLLLQSISVGFWGVIFCLLLKTGKTIANPVLVHFIFDYLIVMFVEL